MGTIRVIFISKGIRYLAPVIGFFEVIIWLLAIGQVMNNLTNVVYIAYGAGFASGTFHRYDRGAVLNGIDLSRCVIGCTGRAACGMVRKSAHAGIPVIISRAATTDKGIIAAEDAGITLVGFSRGDRFTIYTHPERIVVGRPV